MKKSVQVSMDRVLHKVYMLRGIKVDSRGNKEVIVEESFEDVPSDEVVASFLYKNDIDFCSLITNYSLER